MRRQRISLSKLNDEQLKKQIDWIKLKLEKAEKSGFTTETRAQILKRSKKLLNG